jgi:hypothetical protein
MYILVFVVAWNCGSDAEGPAESVGGGGAAAIATPVAISGDESIAGSFGGGGLDLLTCQDALGRATAGFTLNSSSLTDSASGENPDISTFCSTGYQSADAGGPFLTAAVLTFANDTAAKAHYDLVVSDLANSGYSHTETESDSRNRIIIEADDAGIGNMLLVRLSNAAVSIHNGPTAATASRWSVDAMLATANDIADRAANN